MPTGPKSSNDCHSMHQDRWQCPREFRHHDAQFRSHSVFGHGYLQGMQIVDVEGGTDVWVMQVIEQSGLPLPALRERESEAFGSPALTFA